MAQKFQLAVAENAHPSDSPFYVDGKFLFIVQKNLIQLLSHQLAG